MCLGRVLQGLLTDFPPAVKLSPKLVKLSPKFPGLCGNEKPPISRPLPRAEVGVGQGSLGGLEKRRPRQRHMVSAKCSPARKLAVNRSRSLETPHTEVTKTEFISFSRGPQGGGYTLAVRLIYPRSRTVERLGPTVLGGLDVLREHGRRSRD